MLMRKIKKLYDNRPWKEIKTRKISFTYCLTFGTLIILFGAFMISFDKNFDTSTWMSEALNFCKFIVGTGTCIVLSTSVKDVVQILKGESSNMEENVNTPDEEDSVDNDEDY